MLMYNVIEHVNKKNFLNKIKCEEIDKQQMMCFYSNVTKLREESETESFWKVLGGKKTYAKGSKSQV